MLIEGYYIIDRRRDIYAVKGLVHPPNKVIAVPKYLWTGSNYIKTENKPALDKIRREYLHENDENYGAPMLAVPLHEIAAVKKPTWNVREYDNELVKTALQLYRELSQYLELEGTGGFTGSILLGLHSERSDIDIAIYGLDKGKEVYAVLQELRRRGITSPLNKMLAINFLKSRKDTSEPADAWLKHEEKKVLTGVFLNKVYNIKLVPLPLEIKHSYRTIKIKRLGKVEAVCRIHADSLSIFTPNMYEIEVVNVIEGSELAFQATYVTSFRSRYAEQARAGDTVKILGTLEEVNENHGNNLYYRILVGVDNVDYMLRT